MIPHVRALECPNCGGTVELRGHARTVNAVCGNCLAVLDARSPSLQVLERFADRQRFDPLIPLGSRAKLAGAEWEAIGFQVRQIVVEGVAYSWSEYLLYNPFRGYRYLTEYRGHWNFVAPMRSLPVPTTKSMRKAVSFGGLTYAHFQSAQAETIFVLGEFPWQVRVGEVVGVDDYVSPPHSISSETTADEVTWSAGSYLDGTELWRAFGLQGSAPHPQGVYSNQPSPWTGRVGGLWRALGLLVLGFLVACMVLMFAGWGSEAYRGYFYYDSAVKSEPAFVTPEFEIRGGNVEVGVKTNLSNDWAFFSFALISQETGQAWDFGREVSYFSGRDSDGNWTEGDQTGTEFVPSVPPGRYYLRVEPDMDDDRSHTVRYEIYVRQGVTGWWWMLVAFLLLPLPPVWRSIQAHSFESRRWAESDYGSQFGSAPSPGGSDDD